MSTYTPIATQTLSTAAVTVTFDGIPQTYTDLVLVAHLQNNNNSGSNQSAYLRFNDDSGNNYSYTRLSGNGSTAASFRESSVTTGYIGNTAPLSSGVWGNFVAHIMGYSNTTTNKTYIVRTNNTNSATFLQAHLWRNSNKDAISRIDINIENTANAWSAGSTFTLYGIGSGSPKAFGGDEVRTDGTYWYHIYRSSGIFAPTQSLSCDYLVVAGGGGGGENYAGGGGAGGLRCTVGATGGGGSLESALTMTLGTNYTVTVGAGGAGASGGGWLTGTPGSNSVFNTITSTGGGGGQGYNGASGGTGGSGGGGRGAAAGTPGSGTTNQGYAGGSGGGGSPDFKGGGGGGAGEAGDTDGLSHGGDGIATDISGSSLSYGGGGGGHSQNAPGGPGGVGGGGNGGDNNSPATAGYPGTVNTGGGGGGGSYSGGDGGNGGSGVVILRYPDSLTITIGVGLTGSTSAASGGFKRTTITAGTGNVSWS